MIRKAVYAACILAAAGAGLLAYALYAPRAAPAGQPPLAPVGNGSLDPIRDLFNATADRTRLLVMLSPT